MSDLDTARHRRARARLLWPGLVAAFCLLRRWLLFVSAAPATPLRVLAIIALDTLHVLHRSRPLPRRKIRELALLLDFQACTNAAWDDKSLCVTGYEMLRQRLVQAGLESRLEIYLDRLGELERRRPSVAGDSWRFDEVRSYREEVARLSLATITSFALDTEGLDHDSPIPDSGGDVEVLFRIAMQCQIIDDVVDYAVDQAAGLPGFLTACASVPQALELTARAARRYGYGHDRMNSDHGILPLRMALQVCTALTSLALGMAHRRHRRDQRQIAEAFSAPPRGGSWSP